MKKVKLNKGMFALVSKEDFELVSRFKWSAIKYKHTFYAVRTDKNKTILMHRVILNLTDSKIHTDHKDHNGLNNQRNNIRAVTPSQNKINVNSHKGSTSKYLGVCRNRNKWMAMIGKKGVRHTFLGRFDTEIEAAKAYNEAAIKIHGEFANLNKF